MDYSRTNMRDSEHRLKEMMEVSQPDGVMVDPTPITSGQEVTFFYNGLLHKSGADQVYIHMGYGNNAQWEKTMDIPMAHTQWGWTKSVTVYDDSRLNFCFKDSANNWDNNNGSNWSYEIHGGHSH